MAAGPLRDGVLVVGLAPCEIASVATTAMAGGEAAVSAGVLIGSTVAAVALAGPILTLEAGHAGFSPAASSPTSPSWWRCRWRSASPARRPARSAEPPAPARADVRNRRPRAARAARRHPRPRHPPRANGSPLDVALAAVAALVALIAAEIRLSAAYLAVAAALAPLPAGSALVGRALGTRAARPTAAALLLTTSMRDFAIAAGLAAAAFGPAAAAPLGLYGIAVLVWGTAAAGVLRRRAAVPRMTPQPPPATANDLVAEKGWSGSRRAGSLQSTVTPSEEVRPMNAVSMWVLSLPVTVGRLT